MKNAADRATDLLIDRITEGLDPEPGRQLDALLEECPDLDVESFELAAAAIELTVTPTSEPMPEALRAQLSQQAADFFKEAEPGLAASHTASSVVEGDFQRKAARAETSRTRQSRRDPFGSLGWLAAAAILILSITFWPRAVKELAPVPSPEAGPTVAALTVAEARTEMIAQASDLVRLEWTQTEDPAATEAGGEVVWSSAEQRGYMTFRGLPVNDPGASQYQLWIFDSAQDERYPVDGGVFDIGSTGEVIIEIDAKLEIKDPTLFAITIEKPGGVVVSSRERLPLLAQVG